jgi:Flp pilus assembly protein TadD
MAPLNPTNRYRHAVLLTGRSMLRASLPVVVACATIGCARRKPAAFVSPLPASTRASASVSVDRPPKDPEARVQLAEQYAGSGETFAAIEQLEVARDLGDHDNDHALRLAGLYDTIGEPEAAAAVLETAAAKQSAAPAVLLGYSRELLKLGEFARAANAIQPLYAQWQAQPDDVRRYIARSLLLAGRAEQAGKQIPATSSDAEWLALRGLQLLLSGQPQGAASALTRSVALNPHQSRNAYLLGQAWLAAGVPARALEAWNAAAGLPDAPPQIAVSAAGLMVQANRFDEATSVMERMTGAARMLPAYWEVQERLARKGGQPVLAQIARGYAAYHSGDPWQAEAIWRAAVPQAQAEDAWAIYTALLNSAALRQDRASLSYANTAAKRFPTDYYLLKSRAELLLEQNARVEALAVAERLPQLEPPDRAGQAADLLARIALKSGKPDLLMRSVQRQRELAPRDPAALLHLIEWQRRQQWTPANLESTLKLCREAITIAPDSAEAYFRAGEVLKSLGRSQEAMTMLRHALTLAPRLHDGAPNVLLAQLEQRQGLLTESRYELRQARWLNRLRDPWPTQMELLYRDHPPPTPGEWKMLGRLALDRHEVWVALCASTRAARLAPKDPDSLQIRAAALSRLGRPDEALAALQAAYASKNR